MYFKSLELVGFKSFADRTQIDFQPGVTAIVGPNGCGKSNISDAIRWVLGEQSAKSLRGSHMEDVIFNGSSSKEAQNFAEVSLTLSNETRLLAIDYDEVTISRRLYRSGESEYLLNKNSVRLRDIHELLMGTGIGTESYSIIEQGKMDVILNSKPDDRREIFEEAAGITKFKSQKKEALRKLEQTDQNLLRVNDIIQEVRRQIGSIERAAKKAEAYRVEFEKLKNFELSVARREFAVFESERQLKSVQLEELTFKESESVILAEELDRIYGEKKAGLDRLDESLTASVAREMNASGEMRRIQDRELLNRERMGELIERHENLLRQIENSKIRIAEFTAEYDSLVSQLEEALKAEAEGLAFLNSAESEFSAIEAFSLAAASETDGLQRVQEEFVRIRTVSQGELARVRAEKAALENRLKRLKEDEAYQRAHSEKVRAEFSEALSLIESNDTALQEKSREFGRHEADLTRLKEEILSAEAMLDAAALEESASRSKLDFLNDLKNRHEGFWGGVKALLAEKESGSGALQGMVGLLADALRVEGGYEFAVEAALGSYLQAVIFEKDEDVIHATEFLRAQKKGRALLVSLELDSHPTRRSDLEGGSADSILKYVAADDAARPLIEKLLAGIYVADDIRAGLQFTKQHPGVVCVTRSGERVEGQIVAAGSNREDENFTLVGRDTRIRDCQSALEAIESSVASSRAALESRRAAQSAAEYDAARLSEEILKIRMELGEKKSQLRHIEESKQRVEENLSQVMNELESLLGEEKIFTEQEQFLESGYDAAVKGEQDASEKLAAIAESIRQKAAERERLLIRLAETRSRQSAFTERREKIEKDKNWILDSKKTQEELAASYEREAADATAKKEALQAENAALAADLSRLALERDEIVRQMEALRLEREDASLELGTIDSQRQENHRAVEDTRKKLHECQMESAQVGFAIDRLKERIFNAYQVDLLIGQDIAQTESDAAAAFAGEDPAAGMSLEDARAEIQKQREKIAKMGPVNLAAVEEHTEMKERYAFLTQQEQDLIKAKEDLHKAIIKINRTTRELFVETFAKIQQYFTEYYKLLFNGGTGELVLLDEENVLESGIEIIARPPGKKPQSISLLSGGEKAMTAVALMFSLFKVKPSPFCILDEIDAPLDEPNVMRFCEVLKQFIIGSQFILITHNKRTMSLADAMYGITMAQTGISRVVSVKFNDRKDLHAVSNGAHGAGEAALVS